MYVCMNECMNECVNYVYVCRKPLIIIHVCISMKINEVNK